MDSNTPFNLMIFTDETKKVCLCSATSIFLIVLFIISPLSNFFTTNNRMARSKEAHELLTHDLIELAVIEVSQSKAQVAVVYFRTLYDPSHFVSADIWRFRRDVEHSAAVTVKFKCNVSIMQVYIVIENTPTNIEKCL